MIKRRVGLARYRMRSTLRDRWAGYLSVIILIGLVGGLGLGSLAAARRTQSSFSVFVAATNPSDFQVSIYSGGTGGSNLGYSASLTREISRLPGVRHVAAGFVAIGAPLTADGAPRIRVTGLAYPVASVNGLFFTQDRLAVNQGRLANPRRPDEIVMAPVVAKLLGFHVGQVIPFGFYSDAQQSLPQFGTKAVPPALRVNMKLVGLGSLSSEIVEDDVDTLPTFLPLTPAFAKEALAVNGLSGALTFGIQTAGGAATVPLVEREVARLAPPGVQVTDHALVPVLAKADTALEAHLHRLGCLRGGRAPRCRAHRDAADRAPPARRPRGPTDPPRPRRGSGGHRVGRLDRFGGRDRHRIGRRRHRRLCPLPDCAIGPCPCGVPRSRILVRLDGSRVRLRLPDGAPRLHQRAPGLHDRTPPGLPPARCAPDDGARVVGFAAHAGLSASGVVGVRMALEPGEGRAAVPVRSALLGSIMAVALVVTTLTFGNSLQTLVSNPPLYGWNWTYILNPVGAGGGEVPQVALSMLKHDKDVAAFSGTSFNNLELDGQEVPFLMESDRAAVTPPILTGHGLGPGGIVLGAATMVGLHKHLGQYVTISFGVPADAPVYIPPTRLRIVGTATLPAIGFASTVSDHTSMGTGMLIPYQVLPKAFIAAIDIGPDPALNGPNLVLVRIRAGVPPATALAGLHRVVEAADRAFAAEPGGSAGNAIVVQGVQRPAEIVNYKSMGLTPAWLVSGLVAGAVVALALTLFSSVRQRRRDLALLKTMGFVRRQLGAAVAWQASVAAVIGIAVGIPLGIVAGRWLWNLFAEQIYAVPYPTVSMPSVILVAVGTLVLANLVAAFPARQAARTPTALMLRGE